MNFPNHLNKDKTAKVNDDELIKALGNNNLAINDDISDDKLLQLSKTEIINFKNKKIAELTDFIDNLVKYNEEIKENYAKSVSFFKHYIETLESEGLAISLDGNGNQHKDVENKGSTIFTTSIDDQLIIPNKIESSSNNQKITSDNFDDKTNDKNKISNSIKKENVIGNFIKCDFCDEIMVISELKFHKDFHLSMKEMLYKVSSNDHESIEAAIYHGFNPNLVIDKSSQNTLLHYIAKNGLIGSLQAILHSFKETLNLDCLNNYKDTPLILSIENKHEDFAIMLVELGASLSIMGRNCQTPLMISCEKGLNKLAKMIVGIDNKLINEKNILGNSSIKIAEENGNDELVQFLINVNTRLPTANSTTNKKKGINKN